MKQCPNPNCMFYTRLEELPDAYVKCPGCRGPLVGVETQPSQELSSGYLPGISNQAASKPHLQDPYSSTPKGYAPTAPGGYDYDYDDDEDEDRFGGSYSRGAAAAGAQPGLSRSYFSTASNSSRWNKAGRAAFAVGSLLLLAACGLLGWVAVNRLFPQSRVIASPQATETALAVLRPPVNTPIPLFTQPPQPSNVTVVVVEPTQPVPTQPAAEAPPPQAPTQTPAQADRPAPTAPPAQEQPTNGVLGARMATTLQGGEPVGTTNRYGPNDALNLAVQADYGPSAVTTVLTRWYGPNGELIYSMQKDYTLPGTHYLGFTLRKSGPWTPGGYRVDILTNNSPTPAYSVPFIVEQ